MKWKKLKSLFVTKDSSGYHWNKGAIITFFTIIITLTLALKTPDFWGINTSVFVAEVEIHPRGESQSMSNKQVYRFKPIQSDEQLVSNRPSRIATPSPQQLAGAQVFENKDSLAAGKDERYFVRLDNALDSRAPDYRAKFTILRSYAASSLKVGTQVLAKHKPIGERMLFEIVSYTSRGQEIPITGHILDGKTKQPGLKAEAHSHFLSRTAGALGLAAINGTSSYYREKSLGQEQTKPNYKNTMRGAIASVAGETASTTSRQFLDPSKEDTPYLTTAPGIYAEMIVRVPR